MRFRHQGRSVKGIDCVGVIIKVAHGLHLTDFDITNYRRRACGNEFLRGFYDQLIPKPKEEMYDGDIILFKDEGHVCHCGIATTLHHRRYFVHAYATHRKVVEEHLAFEWPNKLYHTCFSFKGIVD